MSDAVGDLEVEVRGGVDRTAERRGRAGPGRDHHRRPVRAGGLAALDEEADPALAVCAGQAPPHEPEGPSGYGAARARTMKRGRILLHHAQLGRDTCEDIQFVTFGLVVARRPGRWIGSGERHLERLRRQQWGGDFAQPVGDRGCRCHDGVHVLGRDEAVAGDRNHTAVEPHARVRAAEGQERSGRARDGDAELLVDPLAAGHPEAGQACIVELWIPRRRVPVGGADADRGQQGRFGNPDGCRRDRQPDRVGGERLGAGLFPDEGVEDARPQEPAQEPAAITGPREDVHRVVAAWFPHAA